MGTTVTRPSAAARRADEDSNNNNDGNNTDFDSSRSNNRLDTPVRQSTGVVAKNIAALASISTPDEDAYKQRAYATLRSRATTPTTTPTTPHTSNLIERIYNEDFLMVDHTQAIRFPPTVTQQLRGAVREEAERRCAEAEKTMARCLQDKMWTSWKCQKQRDAYYACVQAEEKHSDDLLTTNRWKYTLGVFHGERLGRNNYMRHVWHEHFPDTALPHPWVKDA